MSEQGAGGTEDSRPLPPSLHLVGRLPGARNGETTNPHPRAPPPRKSLDGLAPSFSSSPSGFPSSTPSTFPAKAPPPHPPPTARSSPAPLASNNTPPLSKPLSARQPASQPPYKRRRPAPLPPSPLSRPLAPLVRSLFRSPLVGFAPMCLARRRRRFH